MKTLSRQCAEKAGREGYFSAMNDTKWRGLCIAFCNSRSKPAWRTKDFLTGHISEWDREWYYHLGPDYCTIEWLEIQYSEDQKEEIIQILGQVGIRFEADNGLRILGYRK